MTIAPLASQSVYTPASVAPSASTASAFDPEADVNDDPATASSLTGSSTGSLSSQTLQALMDLIQGSGDQSGGSQVQGAHRHHHHGGQQAQQGGTGAAATDTASATTDAAGETTAAPA